METRAREIAKRLITDLGAPFDQILDLPLKSQLTGLAVLAHMGDDARVRDQMLGILEALEA